MQRRLFFMAVNESIFRRPSDRGLFLAAAVLFPLLVFLGYLRTYYLSSFFDINAVANNLVHAHGIIMSIWVVYFAVQVAMIRSKNIKLHMTLGFIGIALAALVVSVGMATAYDAQLVRASAPPGVNPHSFFILPAGDMALFVLLFSAAIYYRKRPAEHKSLMLMTAINFLPAAFFRAPFIPPQYLNLWSFGLADLIAVACLVAYSVKHRKINKVFLAAVVLFVLSAPFRFWLAETQVWLNFVEWLAP